MTISSHSGVGARWWGSGREGSAVELRRRWGQRSPARLWWCVPVAGGSSGRSRRGWLALATFAVVGAQAACGGSAAGSGPRGAVSAPGRVPAGTSYVVYWDQNEELDVLAMPSGRTGTLVAPWDANGQLCLMHDGSGRLATGYKPTLPDQHNPGGVKPYMQPPVGIALWNRNGSFSGTTMAVHGPSTGGVGPHHVDGHGGLEQPGLLTFAPNGDLLLPEGGTGQVLRIAHASLPASAADCGPNGLYPPGRLQVSVFLDAATSKLPFPQAVARDPACGCWAVDSVISPGTDPAVAFFDDNGRPLAEPGTPLGAPGAYNPYGLAFAPDGTLYFVDIHISCKDNQISQCGPTDLGGRIMAVTFDHGTPSAPRQVAGGFDFPLNVTVCVPASETCPFAPAAVAARPPASGPTENGAPAVGPRTTAPATAGNGT